MAQLSGTLYPTEFSGSAGTVSVAVTGGTQTGTIQFTNLTTIRAVHVNLTGTPDANTGVIRATATTNIVTVRQYTMQGTLNTQTASDFYLTVIGEY